MESPQKPQKSRKKPQKSPLPSRKKPQNLPQKTGTIIPPAEPEIKAKTPLKSDPSSESFGIVDSQQSQAPGPMADLLLEAKGGTADPGPGDAPQEAAPGAAEAGAAPAVDAIPVKDSFTDVMTNIWFSVLRMGTQYAAKADLSPMSPDQRGRLNSVFRELAEKHAPPMLLAMQEEMSLAGVSAEIVMTNIKKAEPVKDGQQDHSSPGA